MQLNMSLRPLVGAALTVSLLTLTACGGGGSDRTVIQNKGSDTLVNVAQAWAERYAEKKPGVAVAVTGGGSGVGISALINGTVDIANASRKMKEKEIEQARKNGVEPMEWIVGYDALAVYVHKDNPVESMTIAALEDIYGEDGETTKWSQIGVKIAKDKDDEIVRISRQNNSGTYAYFKKTILGKKKYKLGTLDMHGSKDVVENVAQIPGAIGYSGLAYATDHVRMVPVKKDDSAPAVAPSVETASNGSYPIARPLLMYTAGEPKGAVKEYLDWILSPEGQELIVKKGYAPVKGAN